MWNLILSALAFVKDALEALKKKPEPEVIPQPVDTKKTDDLLNPKDK